MICSLAVGAAPVPLSGFYSAQCEYRVQPLYSRAGVCDTGNKKQRADRRAPPLALARRAGVQTRSSNLCTAVAGDGRRFAWSLGGRGRLNGRRKERTHKRAKLWCDLIKKWDAPCPPHGLHQRWLCFCVSFLHVYIYTLAPDSSTFPH